MSKKSKLTPAFPASVEPVRKGIYLCRWRHGEWYSLWDGEWHWGGNSPKNAYRNSPIRGGDVLTSWRGLAADPLLAGHTSKGTP